MLKSHSSYTALFSVSGGGCNGLRYQLEPTHEPKDDRDEELALGGGRNLRVCGKSMIYLTGTKIDWQNNFMGQALHFDNPYTPATCGCGSTFLI